MSGTLFRGNNWTMRLQHFKLVQLFPRKITPITTHLGKKGPCPGPPHFPGPLSGLPWAMALPMGQGDNPLGAHDLWLSRSCSQRLGSWNCLPLVPHLIPRLQSFFPGAVSSREDLNCTVHAPGCVWWVGYLEGSWMCSWGVHMPVYRAPPSTGGAGEGRGAGAARGQDRQFYQRSPESPRIINSPKSLGGPTYLSR